MVQEQGCVSASYEPSTRLDVTCHSHCNVVREKSDLAAFNKRLPNLATISGDMITLVVPWLVTRLTAISPSSANNITCFNSRSLLAWVRLSSGRIASICRSLRSMLPIILRTCCDARYSKGCFFLCCNCLMCHLPFGSYFYIRWGGARATCNCIPVGMNYFRCWIVHLQKQVRRSRRGAQSFLYISPSLLSLSIS